ncbi:membrane domain protein [Mycobacterium xenopi 3993]|nr:membrane domain protein [Mycobacterium xenopi 3993]
MSARGTGPTPDPSSATKAERPKLSTRALAQVIERSARLQGPAAQAYVARLRRANPDATPAQIAAKLEKRYLAAVTGSGAAVGSAALFPGSAR